MSLDVAVPIGVSIGVVALAAVLYVAYKLYVSKLGERSTNAGYLNKIQDGKLCMTFKDNGHASHYSNSQNPAMSLAMPTAQSIQQGTYKLQHNHIETRRQSSMDIISADNEYRDAVSGTKVFYNPLAEAAAWNNMHAAGSEEMIKAGVRDGVQSHGYPENQHIRAPSTLRHSHDLLDISNQHADQDSEMRDDRIDVDEEDAYTATLLSQLQQLLDEVNEESRVVAGAGLTTNCGDPAVPASEAYMAKPTRSTSPTKTPRLRQHLTGARYDQQLGMSRSDSQLSEAMAIAVGVVSSTRQSITNISRSLDLVQALQEEQQAVDAWVLGQQDMGLSPQMSNPAPKSLGLACDEVSPGTSNHVIEKPLARQPLVETVTAIKPINHPGAEWQRWSRQFQDVDDYFASDRPHEEVVIPSVASLSQKLASLTDMASRMSERLSNHQPSSKRFDCDGGSSRHRIQTAVENARSDTCTLLSPAQVTCKNRPEMHAAGSEHATGTPRQPPALFRGHALPPALVPIDRTTMQPKLAHVGMPITNPFLQVGPGHPDTHTYSSMHDKHDHRHSRQPRHSFDAVRSVDQT